MSKGDLIKAVSIFDEISATSGAIAKQKLLKENENNELFKKMLLFLYNPYVKTGIGFKKLVKFATFRSDDVKQFKNIEEVMVYLAENNTGRDEDVKALANFINQQEHYRTHDFLQEFFTEDVKIGATANTINKVYGKGTIPQFKVMLAESLTDHMDYIEGETHVTLLKYDGVRCTVVKDGSPIFFTRKGLPIEGLTELEQVFNYVPDKTVYEGELIVINYADLESKDAYKATSKIVRKDGEKLGLAFIVFDTLSLDEFNSGESNSDYSYRLSLLYDINLHLAEYLEQRDLDQRLFDVAKVVYRGNDINETLKLAEKYIAEGQEGLVVRKTDAKYVAKRSKDLLRIKDVRTADLRIVDVEEGTKKSTIGRLGAIVVDYKGFRVNVGGGFKSYERDELWLDRDNLIGKIVEVIYTEETSNEQGGLSMRFPRFKGIRDDKDEVNID